MFSPILVALFTAIIATASARVTSRGHSYGIVGGVPANITELPHQVYLRHKVREYHCGGSIISRNHILTSAVCVKDFYAENVEVVLGTASRIAGDGQVFQVAEITIHENYTTSETENDIAVLTLVENIEFSDKAKVIALAKPEYEVKDGTELVVSGWGFKSIDDDELSYILRKVTVPKLSSEECSQRFNMKLHENELCAGGEVGKGTSAGDGGTALIEKTKDGNLQVGILSWGTTNGSDDFPDVYTEVSKYYDWINNIVKPDLEKES